MKGLQALTALELVEAEARMEPSELYDSLKVELSNEQLQFYYKLNDTFSWYRIHEYGN